MSIKVATANVQKYIRDSWTLTPFTFENLEGEDLSLSALGNLFDADQPFVEVRLAHAGNDATGVGQAPTKVYGALEVDIYTLPGTGTGKVSDIVDQLSSTFEGKTLAGIRFRWLQRYSPINFRGRVLTAVQLPVEFETPLTPI